MTLINDLDEDQRDLIIERLGMAKVRLLEANVTNEVIDKVPTASGDRVRGRPRRSHPVSRFYQACLREMGEIKKGARLRNDPLTPGRAWLEVQGQATSSIGRDPTFSHPAIAETVEFFGGWSPMWAEFNRVLGHTARNKFIMAYKDIVAGTIK